MRYDAITGALTTSSCVTDLSREEAAQLMLRLMKRFQPPADDPQFGAYDEAVKRVWYTAQDIIGNGLHIPQHYRLKR